MQERPPINKASAAAHAAYKAVLIRGKGMRMPKDISDLYQTQGYLLIGDGNTPLDSLDLTILKDRIDSNTHITIDAHGSAKDGSHFMGMSTKTFLANIAKYSDNQPLNVSIVSCYCGAAAPDVEVLPRGSVLVAHGPKDASVASDIADETILQSSRDLSITDPVKDFLHRFALKVKNTTTISIKKADDSVFQHTVRPPKYILTDPRDIAEYLSHERIGCVLAYDQSLGTKTDISKLPAITEDEAIEWRNDSFIAMVMSNNNMELIEALETRPKDFVGVINYKRGKDTASALALSADLPNHRMINALLTVPGIDANPALITAAQSRNYEAVKTCLNIPGIRLDTKKRALMHAAIRNYKNIVDTLLDIQDIGLNEKILFDNTPLMYAAKKGYRNIVESLLKRPDIKINERDKDGNTALMLAIKHNRYEVVETMLKRPDIKIDEKDKDGNTVLMLAVMHGGATIVKALLKMPGIDLHAKNNAGATALILAATRNDSSILQELNDRLTPNIVDAINKAVDLMDKGDIFELRTQHFAQPESDVQAIYRSIIQSQMTEDDIKAFDPSDLDEIKELSKSYLKSCIMRAITKDEDLIKSIDSEQSLADFVQLLTKNLERPIHKGAALPQIAQEADDRMSNIVLETKLELQRRQERNIFSGGGRKRSGIGGRYS